jgi:hypothetical protein
MILPTIKKECSDFLNESNGEYIVKNLPKNYDGFAKVKVRLGKKSTKFSKNFNTAFRDKMSKLYQRAIFTYTDISKLESIIIEEPFFIFPINGYKYIFNPEIEDSKKDYNELNINDILIAELLELSYQNNNLNEAFNYKCEIIFYNISYYYAIRASIVEDYKLFFK